MADKYTPWGNVPDEPPAPKQGPVDPFEGSSMTAEKWAAFESKVLPIDRKHKKTIQQAMQGFANDIGECGLDNKKDNVPAAMIMFAMSLVRIASNIGGASSYNLTDDVVELFVDEAKAGFFEGREEFNKMRETRGKNIDELMNELEAASKKLDDLVKS